MSRGSKLKDVVALSSLAISHAMQEELYMRMLQMEMGFDPEEGGTPLSVDNQSSIKLA